jgi:hypothetical protein
MGNFKKNSDLSVEDWEILRKTVTFRGRLGNLKKNSDLSGKTGKP